MSDDPETLRQISELSLDDRPLLVIDVDDVLLHFLEPFIRYLDGHGLRLALTTFKLYGNIVHKESGAPADQDTVRAMIATFFEAQGEWQTLTDGAATALDTIGKDAEIVMLTAMPHQFRDKRRALLDRLNLPYPLLTTETPKGPALRMLRGNGGRPVAFVDDIPHNHQSVKDSVPDAAMFQILAMPEVRPLLPPIPDGVVYVEDWADATPRIARALGIAG